MLLHIPEGLAPGPSTGAAWLDFDGDGDMDLHVLRDQEARDIEYTNDGICEFGQLTTDPIGDLGNGEGMDWGDYDNDGDLDLYLVNATTANKLFRNEGGTTFTDVTTPPLDHGFFDQGAVWTDYDRDGFIDLYLTTHFSANKLYRNLGTGAFTEVTPPALAIPLKCGSSTWGDYDNDGDSDVYVSVQDGPDVLARNDGNGTFTDVSAPPLNDAGIGQGVAWGDYDNDGDLDIYLCNFGQANRLFRNDGATFSSVATGDLAHSGPSQSGTWGDFDNDRDLDLVLTTFGQGNFIFRNDGNGFSRLYLGAPEDSVKSLGASWGDYDEDGDLDLFVTGFGSLDRLYQNFIANGNNWLEITLEGTASNRSAVGARISAVDHSAGVTQVREHGSNHGFWSCNAPAEHFGLGSSTQIDFLQVRWPSGLVEYFPDVTANQRLHLIEGSGVVGVEPAPSPVPIVIVRPNPFRESTEILWSGMNQGRAELLVFDVQGRLVRSLTADLPDAIRWDGLDANGKTTPDGVYFYRVEVEQKTEFGKLIRLR
jgi:hypothetical protein